ncbi:MAG: hypothetical protein J6575_03475 [Bifidobacterium sp.]|nr:hypothetical protein [Bifidobacterium sp.]
MELGINKGALISAKRGAVFVAPAKTKPPKPLSQLVISSSNLGAWKNLGHTSESNLPKFNTEGGDPSSLNTWLVDGAKTTYKPTSLSVAIKSIQADVNTLKFIYNGWKDPETGGVNSSLSPASQNVALIILSYDPDLKKQFGVYFAETSIKADGMPDFSGDFVEFGFTASAQSSDAIEAGPNGEQAAFTLLTPDVFDGASLSLDKQSLSLTVGGDDGTVTATVTPESTNVTFESEDESKFTVTSTGAVATIHPVAATTAPVKLKATAGSLEADCDITVAD